MTILCLVPSWLHFDFSRTLNESLAWKQYNAIGATHFRPCEIRDTSHHPAVSNKKWYRVPIGPRARIRYSNQSRENIHKSLCFTKKSNVGIIFRVGWCFDSGEQAESERLEEVSPTRAEGLRGVLRVKGENNNNTSNSNNIIIRSSMHSLNPCK